MANEGCDFHVALRTRRLERVDVVGNAFLFLFLVGFLDVGYALVVFVAVNLLIFFT